MMIKRVRLEIKYIAIILQRDVWNSFAITDGDSLISFWDRVTSRLMEGPIEIVTTTTIQ